MVLHPYKHKFSTAYKNSIASQNPNGWFCYETAELFYSIACFQNMSRNDALTHIKSRHRVDAKSDMLHVLLDHDMGHKYTVTIQTDHMYCDVTCHIGDKAM